MRKKVVAGNWKMNKTGKEGAEFAASIAKQLDGAVEVVFCVPYTSLWLVNEAVKDTQVAIGAQNMHFKDNGAFTGELSADMLLGAGAKYVIIGHSERRQYFGETDETVNLKLHKAIEKGLAPIVCVGESLTQRKQGITDDLLRMQVRIAYADVSKEVALATIIAYEPIWAIGTGEVATNEQAQAACACIREFIAQLYDIETAQKIRILYGGSVAPDNAAGLFAMPDIDGGLVGGASLKPDFVEVINAAR